MRLWWQRQDDGFDTIRDAIAALPAGNAPHAPFLADVGDPERSSSALDELAFLARAAACRFASGRAKANAEPYQPLADAIASAIESGVIHPSDDGRVAHALACLRGEVPELVPASTCEACSALERRLDFASALAETLCRAEDARPLVVALADLHLADRDTLELIGLITRELDRVRAIDDSRPGVLIACLAVRSLLDPLSSSSTRATPDETMSELRARTRRLARNHARRSAIALLESSIEHGNESASEADRRAAFLELAALYRDLNEPAMALEKLTLASSFDESTDIAERSRHHRLMGETALESGNLTKAALFFESSLRLAESEPSSPERAEALLDLSLYNSLRGRFDLAESFARRALDEGSPGGSLDGRLEIRARLRLGDALSRRGDHGAALELHTKALELAEAARDESHTLEALDAVASTHAARGERDRALGLFRRAALMATELGAVRSLARVSRHLGALHLAAAEHELALEAFRRSLDLLERLDDRRRCAMIHDRIGTALTLGDRPRQAIESHRRAIEMLSAIGDEHGQALAMGNLARALATVGQHGEALEYASRGLGTLRRLQSKKGMAAVYHRLGEIYRSIGELDRARSSFERAMELRRDLGEKAGLTESTLALAELYALRAKLERALALCDEAENEFDVLDLPEGQVRARVVKATILEALGELDTANAILTETLTWARQIGPRLTGKVLRTLAEVHLDAGELDQARHDISKADGPTRQSESPRDLAELTLLRCRLEVDSSADAMATSKSLASLYDALESGGFRDLVAVYFLVLGRFEIGKGDRVRGEKAFERCLVEARETGLPLIESAAQAELGNATRASGDLTRARGHFERSSEVLETIAEGLSEKHRETFLAFTARHDDEQAPPEMPSEPVRPAPRADALVADVDPAAADPSRLERIEALNQRLLRLAQISKALNSELELAPLLERVMDAAFDLMKARRCFVVLLPRDEDGNAERIHVSRSRDTRRPIPQPESEISRSIIAESLRTERPVLTRSAVTDSRFAASESIRTRDLLSVLCIPLRSNDGVLGALYVDNPDDSDAFDDDDLRLLETLADQATTAITNARLSEALQSRNRELFEANQQTERLNEKLLDEIQQRATELEIAREEVKRQRRRNESDRRFDDIVGKSEPMRRVFQQLERIAATPLATLVQGGSGTGKELIAQAIHRNSPRANARFVSESCAALAESLLESELFGHVKGAFTGATTDRKGLFEVADSGTLFLDEVAEMSPGMQTKLLRVLETGEIRPVGGKDHVRVDVRFISASNRDLMALVHRGEFREDLYYRLAVVQIDVPSLRERVEDIPLLTNHFLDEIAAQSNLPRKTLTEDAMRLLVDSPWPGNVRELKHTLERAALLTEGDSIGAEQIALEPSRKGRGESKAEFWEAYDALDLPAARDLFVRGYVERCYRRHDTNVTQAAEACGMSRESFHRFLRKYGLRRHRS